MASITYYGQSCFLVETNGVKILFDPFITGNELAKDKVDMKAIMPDVICITHGHEDHCLDAAAIARQSGAKFVSTLEVGNYFQTEKNVGNVQSINQGGTLDVGSGVKIKSVNAVHTSSNPDGSYAGNPVCYVVSSPDATYYHCGDTALTYDMKLIGESFRLDFALLCIGDHYTMGVDDAIRAADFVGCDNIIGMHYDTYPPIRIDHDAAIASFKRAGKTLTLMDIAQTSTLSFHKLTKSNAA